MLTDKLRDTGSTKKGGPDETQGVRHRGLQNFSIGGLEGGERACLKLLLLEVLLSLRNIVHIKEWGEVKGIAKACQVTRGAAWSGI